MKACENAGIMMLFVTAVAFGSETNSPALTRAERETIIVAATQAASQHRTEGPNRPRGEEIARPLWGKAIETLHPLRVLHDITNVFIVMGEDGNTQEGLYVFLPGSSYIPVVDDRFLSCVKLSQSGDKTLGEIYRCKIKKPKASEDFR